MRLELRSQRRNQFQRLLLLVVLQIADFEKRLRAHHRADRHRIIAIQHLHRLEARQIGINLRLGRDVHAIIGMGQDEAIDADHHRAGQRFGKAECLDMQIRRLLIGLGVELDPAGIAQGHAVGMIVPDVDRRADGAIADGHHDRQSQTGGVVHRLGHEQDALAGGGRVTACSRGGCADRHRQRRELRFDIDELAVFQRAAFDHLAQSLDDVGLRRDRIGADHLRPAQRNGFGHGARSFDLLKHA